MKVMDTNQGLKLNGLVLDQLGVTPGYTGSGFYDEIAATVAF
jgi:hypothetical protein